MCFLCLSLLLALRPAQAQGGGHWGGLPCDAQGKDLPTNTYNNGFYSLYGPQSGTISHTYPVPMINAALAYPGLYGDYLYAANPTGATQLGAPSASVSFPGTASYPNDRVGAFTPGFANASNYGNNGEGSYFVDAAHGGPSSGPVIGSVTADMSGTLLCYFHMYWSGPGPQPASADFLVSTQLYAQASADYGSGRATSGLSVTATVTVDAFKETASASAGDGASLSGVQSVNGFHLVRAAVDPKTGIAEVYVAGTTHWVISDTAPYATAGATTAVGGSLVRAGAIPDSRDLTISATVDATNKKVPLLDANGNQTKDANGDSNYTSAPNTRGTDGTMHGDTIYSYHNYVTQNNTDPPIVLDTGTLNWIYLSPAFIGGWHSNAQGVFLPSPWQWSPNESHDTWDQAQCSMPWAPNYTMTDNVPNGQDSPKTYPIKYSATDSMDGANATANYVMTVHDPLESNYPDHESDIRTNWRQITINLQSSGLQDNLGGGIAITIAYSLSASFGGPEGSWIAKTLGFNLVATAEEDYQTTSSISTSKVPIGWVTAIWEYDHYYDHVGKVDTWTTTGYGGTTPYYIREIPSDPKQQSGIVMGTPGPFNSTHP